MSTYSQAWHDMDPAVRDSYRSFADLNTRFRGKVQWLDEGWHWLPFRHDGIPYPAYAGYHVAQRNFTIQLWLLGSFNKNLILQTVPFETYDDLPQPMFDVLGLGGYATLWGFVDLYCDTYPRLTYRIPKSYWTGAPRRRRNL